jgi:hypothetical protein
MSLHYHPDKHDASEHVIWTSQIQILNTMRDTLLNKEERHKYDRQSRIAPVMLYATSAAPLCLHSIESGVATRPASIQRRRQ